jgi:hypothetical protein
MAIAGVAAFCLGLLDRRSTGPLLIGIGSLMFVLGLVLPVASEAELGLTALKFKTVQRREATVRPAIDAGVRRDAGRFAFVLTGDAGDARRIVTAAVDHTVLAWTDGNLNVVSRELHCAIVREYLGGVSLGIYPSVRLNSAVPVGLAATELAPTAAALHALPPLGRAILLLHVRRDLPVSAITRIVRIPAGKVREELAAAQLAMDLPVDVEVAAIR